jgi:cytochrome c-type biogenesis protein CcmF
MSSSANAQEKPMRVLGETCLLVGLVATGYAAFLSILKAREGERWSQRLALAAAVIGLAALSTCLLVLSNALFQRDFTFEYVAQYASRLLPWQYCLSALWVGQAGSLLLWAWMMAALAVLTRIASSSEKALRNTAFGLVMGNVCFLLAVMVVAADPMAGSLIAQDEGAGLSPLLQHPSMLIHPPIVFLAYSAWTFPCAFALAALWHRKLDARWLELARPWALAAWTLLGAGLLLGAHWAYQELGWGGYWGWDPVENGSFLPWLTGTAFIHATLAWRHRGALKKSALLLAIVTYALCNFATFLTRSGIFSSVHAFSESPIGWMFLVLMIGLLASGVWMVWQRRSGLDGDKLATSIVSREILIAASVFLLVLLTLVVMAGTLVAPLSKMFAGRMIQVGPAFYNNVLPTVALGLLAMTAAVPLLRWGASPRARERRLLAIASGVSGLVTIAAMVGGVQHPLLIAILALGALTVATLTFAWMSEARRRGIESRWRGMLRALGSSRRKYAAYFVHVGIACVAIGVAGSSLGTQRQELTVAEGDVVHFAGRQVRYARLEQFELPDKLVAEALLEVSKDGGKPVTLRPARHLHLLQNEWTTEVAIDSSWSGDFYTVLHAGLGEGRISLTLVSNPMIRWMWMGGILATASAMVAAIPDGLRRRSSSRFVAADGRLGGGSIARAA